MQEFSQGVVAVMRQGHVDRALRAELLDARQVGAHGEPVLHARHDGQDIVMLRGLDRIRRGRDANRDRGWDAGHPADLLQHGDGALIGGVLRGRGTGELRNIGDEAGGAEAAPEHFRQIDFPSAVMERVRTGWPGNVDVGIQGDHGTVDGKRVWLHDIVHAVTLTDNGAARKGNGWPFIACTTGYEAKPPSQGIEPPLGIRSLPLPPAVQSRTGFFPAVR